MNPSVRGSEWLGGGRVGQRNFHGMLDLASCPTLGPYSLTRELAPMRALGVRSCSTPDRVGHFQRSRSGPAQTPAPRRFLALHNERQTSHVAYCFGPAPTRTQQRHFTAAVQSAALFQHTHALAIQQYLIDAAEQAWILTPYSGDADGLRTLARLLHDKGGQMSPAEAELALRQLLSVSAAAYDLRTADPVNPGDGSAPVRAACAHGPIGLEDVLVDRHGSLIVELYGLDRAVCALPGSTPNADRPSHEEVRDEVRSLVEIGYQLVTGLKAEEPMIPAGRVAPNLPATWSVWLDRGLDPSRGFDTPALALAAMPGSNDPRAGEPAPRLVRSMLARLRTFRGA